MTFDDAVAGFSLYLLGEKRAALRTVESYAADLAGLRAFLEERNVAKLEDVRTLDIYTLRGWLGSLARTHAPSTIARRIAAVRTFMRWLLRRGVIAVNAASQLATPK